MKLRYCSKLVTLERLRPTIRRRSKWFLVQPLSYIQELIARDIRIVSMSMSSLPHRDSGFSVSQLAEQRPKSRPGSEQRKKRKTWRPHKTARTAGLINMMI